MPLFTINRTVSPGSECKETMETAKFAMACMTIMAIGAIVFGALYKVEAATIMGIIGMAIAGVAGLSNFQPKATPGMTTATSTTTSSTPTVAEPTKEAK